MPFYEYKVVPAPEKAPKAKGLKGPAKFAFALETVMNTMGADGWEYHRAETLPDEERKGFTGRVSVTRNVLIFRRELVFEETTSLTEEPAAAAHAASEPEPEPEPATGHSARAPLVADRQRQSMDF